MESNNKPLRFARPGDPQAPCIAVLDWKTSKLTLVNLEGGNSEAVKICEYYSCGMVTICNEVFAVTEEEILKIHRDGKTTTMKNFDEDLNVNSKVVSFQKKLYIIEPNAGSTLCFDPANNSFIDNLPGPGLRVGFCAGASGNFIYAMGGPFDYWYSLKVMKYDPVQRRWTEVASLRRYMDCVAAVTMNEKIYVIGYDEEDRVVQFCDRDSDSWTEMSKMSVRRPYFFGAVVVNGRLYAVEGDGVEKENGLFEHSIEVLHGDQWKMVTKFESVENCYHATVWPHGSLRSDYEDLPRDINNEYNQLKGNYVIRISKNISREGSEIEISESKISVPQGAVRQKKKVTFIARVDLDEEKGLLTLSEVLECRPPMTFKEPVAISMKTCISALAGKIMRVTLFTQEDPETEWKETEDLILDENNEVTFKICRCSAMKIATKSAEGMFRLISDFYIHSPAGWIAITFSKNKAIHDTTEEVMHRRGFVNFAIAAQEVTGDFGAEISLALKCKTPTDCRVSDPSSIFEVDSKYFKKDNHFYYSELEPEPSDRCNRIKIMYKCEVKGELEECFLLKTEWPREKPKTASATGVVVGDNATVNFNRDVSVHAGDVLRRASFSLQILWIIFPILVALLFRYLLQSIYQI